MAIKMLSYQRIKKYQVCALKTKTNEEHSQSFSEQQREVKELFCQTIYVSVLSVNYSDFEGYNFFQMGNHVCIIPFLFLGITTVMLEERRGVDNLQRNLGSCMTEA